MFSVSYGSDGNTLHAFRGPSKAMFPTREGSATGEGVGRSVKGIETITAAQLSKANAKKRILVNGSMAY